MGYETRLYIGSVGGLGSRSKKIAVLTEDFMGIGQGTAFTVWDNPYKRIGGEGFYLLDGNTYVFLNEMVGKIRIVPPAEYHYFSVMTMIDMCRIGTVSSYLKPTDILFPHGELYVGEYTKYWDCYGDDLVIYKGKSVLRALRKMARDDEESNYWRWKLATHALSHILNKAWQDNIGVICYGY